MGRCEKLKWNRRKLGLSQAELSKKLGLSQSTISILERDETAWITLRDSTDDAVYEKLRALGSWQSDVDSIFKDDVSDIDIREIRKKVRDKRQEMGLSQRELGAMLGIDVTTISHFENHDKYWKNGRSKAAYKLIQFANGEYDVESNEMLMEGSGNPLEVSVIRSSNALDPRGPENMDNSVTTVKDIKDLTEEDLRTITTYSGPVPIETTLNDLIDILQNKVAASKSNDEFRVYISMIGGLCDGYLRYK